MPYLVYVVSHEFIAIVFFFFTYPFLFLFLFTLPFHIFQYVMNISSHGRKTIHEEMCRSLAQLLQPSNMDQLTTNKILKHSQFFFAFIARSMALHLLTTARIKVGRVSQSF